LKTTDSLVPHLDVVLMALSVGLSFTFIKNVLKPLMLEQVFTVVLKLCVVPFAV